MIFLKQSTASQEIPIGNLVDSTDGNSEETGLTIANTDILLWKAGATALASKHSGGATHISNGIYYAVLDATDTDTAGSLRIFVHKSGSLAFWIDAVVLTAKVYDSLIAGSDNLEVDAIQLLGTAWLTPGTAGTPDVNVKLISGDATAADNLEAACDGNTYNVGGGAVVAASVTTKTGYQLAADQAVNATKIGGTTQTGRDLGASVLISSGSGAGQLDVTSGVIKANLAQILGTALTETAGYLAAAFKKFFNIETPVLTVASVNQTGDSYAKVDTEVASIEGKIDTIDSNVDAIKAKTDMLPEDHYH